MKAFLESHVSSRALFLSGALLLPAFVLQQDLAIRSLEVLLFFLLCGLSGKRVGAFQAVFVAAGIVVFNLVVPAGRVLFSVFGLPITEGALRLGIAKATAVIGMIALSRFSIRPDLHLPGFLGGLIGRTFFYYEKIMGSRARIRRERLIGSLDEVLIDIQGAPGDRGGGGAAHFKRTSPAGLLAISILIAALWGAFVLSILKR